MAERYPVFSEQGDRIQAALQTQLEATHALNRDEMDSVAEVVAASYQKALQLRYVVETLVAAAPEDRTGLADGLEAVEELLGTLATWHATTRDKLFSAAQRVRSARP
jgi:hypothetical protein